MLFFNLIETTASETGLTNKLALTVLIIA